MLSMSSRATTLTSAAIALPHRPLWDDPLTALYATARAPAPLKERVSGARIVFSTGREHDGPTGLYYYRARYYQPQLARFISEDPIGFASDDTNVYAYVRNAPTRWADPSGLQAVPIPAPVPVPLPLPPVFIPGTPENQRFVETTIDVLQSLMGRKQRESGLENLSDEEIQRRARDKSLPIEERRRYAREEKYRDLKNKGKDRGGPVRPMGFMALEPVSPLDAIDIDGSVPLSGRKR
jgi:RHS repeat-associated protein